MTFVEEHQDSIKNENEYIEYCNLLMAAFKNPPNNPGENPNSAPANVPHAQYDYESVIRGSMVNSFQTNFWDVKVFEQVLIRIHQDSANRTRTQHTMVSPSEVITERKHRFSKAVLLEKAKAICLEKRLPFIGLKYRNKDQIVLWLEHWTL
jgi:hypothetical protein